MAMVNEVKCARCDRKYSGVRSRCPYCGARRIGRGKYSEGSDNATGKMLISVLILAVFTVAAGILLFTTPNDAEAVDPASDPSISNPEDEINEEVGMYPVETATPMPVETDPPLAPLVVTSLTITYDGSKKEEFTAKVGETVPLRVKVEPPGVEVDIVWSSSDEEVFSVVSVELNNVGVNVTGVGVGNGILTVSAGGIEQTCKVYVTR